MFPVEQMGHVKVAAGQLGGRDVALDRVAHEWMDEPKRFAGQEDLDGGQSIGGPGGLRDLQPGQRHDVPKRHVVAQNRHGPGQGAGVRAQPAHPNPDRAGYRVGCQRTGVLGQLARVELRFVLKGQQQLVQVERVARGDLRAHLGQLVVGPGPQCVRGQSGDRANAKGRQRQHADVAMLGDHVEEISDPVLAPGTHRHHHGKRQLVQPLEHVEHELERRRVGPMQIVDRQQSRSRLQRVGHEREQGVRDGQIASRLRVGLEQL